MQQAQRRLSICISWPQSLAVLDPKHFRQKLTRAIVTTMCASILSGSSESLSEDAPKMLHARQRRWDDSGCRSGAALSEDRTELIVNDGILGLASSSRSTSVGSCAGQSCMPQFRHRFCAFCYTDDPGIHFIRCNTCNKRRYCSHDCLQADQQAGHSNWCGVTGELGHDFEIRVCDSKGARVYACRTFQKHERIMADRMLLRSPYSSSHLQRLPEHQRSVIARLSPHTSFATAEDKVTANQVRLLECPVASATTENGFGVFGVVSRVNHCCLGNSEPLFIEDTGPGWQMLVSTREICAGEEITFCYAPMMDAAARHAYLRNVYGFSCVCRACMQPELRGKLAAIEEHEREIMVLAERRETVDAAVAKGYEQLELLRELQCSSRCLARVYYDLFQVAVSKRGNARVAAQLASLALRHRVAFVGEEDEEAQRYKLFATRPQAHRNYGLL